MTRAASRDVREGMRPENLIHAVSKERGNMAEMKMVFIKGLMTRVQWYIWSPGGAFYKCKGMRDEKTCRDTRRKGSRKRNKEQKRSEK